MASSPLQKAPLGVLGAFALKVMGKNPDRFGDTITPIIDLYDQYLEPKEDRVVSTIAIGARTQTAVHTPPSGFAWRVIGIGVNLTLAIGDIALTGTTVTSFTSPAVGGSIVRPNGDLVINGATGLQRAAGLLLERPFWMPPGWQIIQRVLLSANVTVAVDVSFTMVVQQIEL